MNKNFIIYKIDTYDKADKKFIDKKGIDVDDIDEMLLYINEDKGYHIRIHNNKNIFYLEI